MLAAIPGRRSIATAPRFAFAASTPSVWVACVARTAPLPAHADRVRPVGEPAFKRQSNDSVLSRPRQGGALVICFGDGDDRLQTITLTRTQHIAETVAPSGRRSPRGLRTDAIDAESHTSTPAPASSRLVDPVEPEQRDRPQLHHTRRIVGSGEFETDAVPPSTRSPGATARGSSRQAGSSFGRCRVFVRHRRGTGDRREHRDPKLGVCLVHTPLRARPRVPVSGPSRAPRLAVRSH